MSAARKKETEGDARMLMKANWAGEDFVVDLF